MDALERIENVLKSEYSTDNFVEFTREIFDSMQLVNPEKLHGVTTSAFFSHIAGYSHVGNYESPEGKKIIILAVELKTAAYVENSRSTQRSFARELIENSGSDAAIIAFYTPGQAKWRLSFVRLEQEMKFENSRMKLEEKLTPAKRYSFLVGRDEPCHTAISRFRNFILNENYNPSLDDIEEAFSVEKVTKEFFERYCEKFYQLQEYLESNDDFKAESQRCGFTSEQFAKKLMGQIVFLYFLQKKGWLGVNVWIPELTEKEYNDVFYTPGAQGRIIKEVLPKIYVKQPSGTYKRNIRALDTISDDDETVLAQNMPRKSTWGSGSRQFLRTIFDFSQKQANKGHFYEEYLEPLFYDTLNRNRGSFAYCPALHARIPFLSGGLFDPIDNYDWRTNYFDIPDTIFSNKIDAGDREGDGILDVFDRYNFTISEDEPMEREVAIDPEMLGKVFENLLEVKDRKSKGAFYTPREIVHYMCQESLINYLVRKTGLKEDDIRDFILYGDFMKDEDTSKEKRKANGGMYISEELFKLDDSGKIVVNRLKDMDDALATVRVADPAVGSGAFPLGMMNEIVRARQNITQYITIGMNSNSKRLLLQNDRSAYSLKRHTIKHSLYAVDIEPSAVDIAQLRLWLSLVIDDDINPKASSELEGHANPLPLPNLECNILCGNSLIDEFKGIKLVKESDILGTAGDEYQMDFGHYTFESNLKKMLDEQDKLFECKDPMQKDELKRNIQAYKDAIIMGQLEGVSEETIAEYKKATQQSSKPFILWQLDFARVFRDNKGFDIVIGNPPYVSTKGQTIESKKLLMDIYGYADDLYYHFIDKAFVIANQSGVMTYITPDTYYTTLTKQKLREKLINKKILKLIQLGHDVFENAMVSTAIIIVNNNCSELSDKIECIDVKNHISIKEASKYWITNEKLRTSFNGSFYMPTQFNTFLCDKIGSIHSKLIKDYFPLISTSRDISKNEKKLKFYRDNLKPGDWTLLGLVTDGGVGLQTGNNGKYIGYREGTKEAARALETRYQKLAEFNASYHCDYIMPDDEIEIWELFESIKNKYDRDVFGQGYIYKIVPSSLIADCKQIPKDQFTTGLIGDATFVPYDKGDKDGNRWYNETPYLINWSVENVKALKAVAGKKDRGSSRFQNSQFYFREGFSYSDIKTFFLKARMKGISIHDVKSMSLFPICDKVPYYYLVTIINSEVIATIVYNFLNNTPSFQMNDCRVLPIIVPTDGQLTECKILFDSAVDIQKQYFGNEITQEERDNGLSFVQQKIDEWVCNLYGVPINLLVGQENFVR